MAKGKDDIDRQLKALEDEIDKALIMILRNRKDHLENPMSVLLAGDGLSPELQGPLIALYKGGWGRVEIKNGNLHLYR